MNVNIAKFIVPLLLLGCICADAAVCFAKSGKSSFGGYSIASYREIPGVTTEEAAAIEALKTSRRSFSYGMIPSTEAFVLPDGALAGFAPAFCELLSDLFGIPFVLEFWDWDLLKNGIDNRTIDFTGELTPTNKRRQFYHMTHPIAQRSLAVLSHRDLPKIRSENDLHGRTIGFWKDTNTHVSVLQAYPSLNIRVADIQNSMEAAEKLKTGWIGAFIVDSPAIYSFRNYPYIQHINFFPLVNTPVSLSTANPDLEPVISVVNKYIAAGGIYILDELYHKGELEYIKYELKTTFTNEQREYLNRLVTSGAKVRVGLENDNYPVSFYDKRAKSFQGIVPDILEEISKIAGIEFEVTTGKDTPWSEILNSLKAGDVSFVSQLIYSEGRKNLYTWHETPYFTSRYALLSRSDYPNLKMHQVVRATVGIGKDSIYEEMYKQWFLTDHNVVYYATQKETLNALERGEIDLMMASEAVLLDLTQYREKSGYKANIVFNMPILESYFGFNKKETVLCGIVSNIMPFINTDTIVDNWVKRVYDYSKVISDERAHYTTIFSIALLFILIVLVIMLLINIRIRKAATKQAVTLSAIYNAILLEPNVEQFEDNLNIAMGTIAQAIDVHHISICKNYTVDGNLYCRQLFKWPVDTDQQQDSELSVNLAYGDFPGWEAMMKRGKCLNSIVRLLPSGVRDFLAPWGVVSALVVPVFMQERYWGLVGFGDCRKERIFTGSEEVILRSASQLFANAMQRQEMTLGIREAYARFESVWLNVECGIFTVDAESREIIDVNPVVVRMFGGNLSDIVGQRCNRLICPAEDGSCPILDKDQTVDRSERKFITANGEAIPVIKSVTKIVRNGRLLLLESFTDISELKIAEERLHVMADKLEVALENAEEANRAKSDFLAKMSHELRTPLNAITGMTELAMRGATLDAAREHMYAVKQASSNLLSLISDILDFSKIEAGSLQIIPGDYCFSSLLHDVINIIRVRVIDSQLRFVVNVDSRIPDELHGDELRIRQILINLLGNAAKYTEKGFVSLAAHGEITGDILNLTMDITDSGKGIRPEDIDRIFEEYTQVGVEGKKGIEGVGLGLVITRSLIRAMGGDISVVSEYGVGSTFTVKLSQKIRNFERLAEVENPETKSVLVCERREIYANSIGGALDNLGVRYSLSLSDAELPEKLSENEFSFIFISAELYKKNKEILLQSGTNAKIVLFAEFGEAVPESSFSVLAMPAYSIPIANTLNGISSDFSYSENGESAVGFIAPEAKILIVDDINTNLKVAEGLLLPYNMQVDLRKSGMAGIEAVQSAQYDLIFMDHKMPEMDGVEAVQRIRALDDANPYFKKVPIIALTANAVTGTREMFLANGFDDFLSKPIDTVKLHSVLEKWIPGNKQKGRGEEAEPKTLSCDKLIEVEGLDVKKGIARSGGTTKLFHETLIVFYEEWRERINDIKASFEADNLPLYATHVHGLKSAAALIGADALSEAAFSLEMAGKRNDAAFIEEHGDSLLQGLESLLMNMYGVLHQTSTEQVLDAEELKSKLGELKSAVEVLDAGAMYKIVERLMELTQAHEMNAVIRKISDNILTGEYDEAAALADDVLKDLA